MAQAGGVVHVPEPFKIPVPFHLVVRSHGHINVAAWPTLSLCHIPASGKGQEQK